MIIQKVIKGINGIDDNEADIILNGEGIKCNWWRNVNTIRQTEIFNKLTEHNLFWHQNHYDEIDPNTGCTFSENTPFISTTAGSVERDIFLQTNIINSAWQQALYFATNGWKNDGFLFYCHLFVLGKESVELEQFSEEIRELNIYKRFSIFQPEGEITAKIVIPSIQIEKYEYYDINSVNIDLRNGRIPSPISTKKNNNYKEPSSFNNIRDLINV